MRRKQKKSAEHVDTTASQRKPPASFSSTTEKRGHKIGWIHVIIICYMHGLDTHITIFIHLFIITSIYEAMHDVRLHAPQRQREKRQQAGRCGGSDDRYLHGTGVEVEQCRLTVAKQNVNRRIGSRLVARVIYFCGL